jgi:hypothetical protein
MLDLNDPATPRGGNQAVSGQAIVAGDAENIPSSQL